ncbi:MAG TPA: glutathione peroxidase [Hanamia sp.]|nr:glutathione peroxidase [Hanamia sp.]
MSFLRKIINAAYPLHMKISKLSGMGIHIYENKNNIIAPKSFYSLHAILNNNEEISFEKYKNKKVLIVNLASQCGFTPQYAELESLHQKNSGIFILGFPANDFGAQEPGSDEEIAEFCKSNYGISFPIFKKNEVKGNTKQDVYRWLTDKNKNGWNELEPQWNFYKYLIDENGNLSKVFSSSVSPIDISF